MLLARAEESETHIRTEFSVETLHARLEECLRLDPSQQAFLPELLAALVQATNAAGAFYLEHEGVGDSPTIAHQTTSTHLQEWVPHFRAAIIDAARKTPTTSARVYELDPRRNLVLALAPTSVHGTRAYLGLALVIGTIPIEAFLIVLQLALSYISLSRRQLTERHSQSEAMAFAGLLEITERCLTRLGRPALSGGRLGSRRSAVRTLAEDLRQFSGAEWVMLGTPSGQRTQLQVVSGLSEFDRRSEFVNSAENLLTTVSTSHEAARSWSGTPHVSMAQLRAITGGEIAAYPANRESASGYAIAIGWREVPNRNDPCFRVIANASPALGAVLAVAYQAPRRRPIGRSGWARRLSVATLVAALIGALAIPVQYRIEADAIAEPEVRRFIAAPFEGKLERIHKRPGDAVNPNDVLATMDGREITLELASLTADLKKTAKQRDIALANGEAGASQIASLRLARLNQRQNLLEERRRSLDIRSPISGILLAGAERRVEGAPVSTGDQLFEVGPIDRLRIELAIPDDQISHLPANGSATVSFRADGERVHEVTITRIRPRAEVRDDQHAFVAEALLPNPTTHPLPAGSRGVATINAGKRPLGWTLFRRPWERVSRWLP